MTGNRIGVEGTKSIIEMVKVNTTLTSLKLLSCEEEEKEKEKRERERRMTELQVMKLEKEQN